MLSLFGSRRRKAATHTLEAIRPLIAIYQHNYGLPATFWNSKFVLGFVGFMIGFHATFTSGHRLSETDKGLLLMDVFGALSNLNGSEIARDYTRLTMQVPKDESFERGADNAAICAFYSIGKLKRNEKTEPWLEQAHKIATATGEPNDPSAIGAALVQLLYVQPLQEEFGAKSIEP